MLVEFGSVPGERKRQLSDVHHIDSLSGLGAFTCGALSGISIALVGHPFDTLKVRVQVQQVMPCGSIARSAAGYLRLTLQHEGLFGLFKGIWPQIAVQMINTGLLFGLQVRKDFPNIERKGIFQNAYAIDFSKSRSQSLIALAQH